MSGPADWRPTASMETLRLRARALASARRFFSERQLLEVDTPQLVRHAVTDRHIDCARVELPGHAAPLFLHTSPEYAMKRLLAAGSGDIYQIGHVFRGNEASRWHNAEFTLMEWYRCGFSMRELMAEVAELALMLLELPRNTPIEYLPYAQAFWRELGVDPLTADDDELWALAIAHALDPQVAERCQRDEWLDWLMGTVIGPRLGTAGLCFVHHYPASQAALARLDPADPRVALRFELYWRGVELANGFEELSDAAQQRARFELDRQQRIEAGLTAPAVDESLLSALAAGLPPVSGVAMGFDRLLMLRTGLARIEEVMPFPLERA
jgi:elongation factor P--(R)-beta-lysine ligase